MQLAFREAVKDDLEFLVQMLADDSLGETREDNSLPLNQAYIDAFSSILNDHNNELIVGELGGQIVGMLQLTFIPYLTHTGSWRCLIEGVRIHSKHRGQGLGTRFFQGAINHAKERKCSIVQLTSDKQRPEALKFYEGLGFQATHEGFKLKLSRQ